MIIRLFIFMFSIYCFWLHCGWKTEARRQK